MSKKFRLLMVLVLMVGLLGGLLTSSVSADPDPGTFIEIPRIDVDDGWKTRIQIQNVDDTDTTVTVEFYGGNPYLCPPNEDGPFYWAEMWVPPGGIWTLQSAIPAGAESAFVYTDPEAYVAVTVDRWGPGPLSAFEISSSYTAVADPSMTGPEEPPYEYFAPYIMHGYNNLDTVLTIQNSGDICASIWIYYKQEGNCEFMKAQHIEQIAPGEAVSVGPGFRADVPYPTPELDPMWLGSAYVTANVPLAIIVDQLSITGEDRGTLLTMRGMPYYQEWNLTWYADLLYREISGWDASIQVQNLTVRSMPTFVTVDFFDQSGDEILFVGDWVCRNGAKTFYLPAIIDLGVNFPFGYVGAAEIESHPQVDYPGEMHEGEPIFAVVDLKKSKVYDESIPGWRHTDAGETQGGAYNAHPYSQKYNAFGWAMPHVAKEQLGVTSRIALRNNGNCNKFKGIIWIYDETGRQVTSIPVPWLHPKHMKVIDLAYFGQIARGFVGAAEFWVGDWVCDEFECWWELDAGVEQLCDVDNNGHVDNEAVMPSVVVLNYGFERELPISPATNPIVEGDLTRVYEAFPVWKWNKTCYGDIFGYVYAFDYEDAEIDPEENEPVNDAYVVADTGQEDWTSEAGGYELIRVPEGLRTVTASKTGFWDWSEDVDLECGADTQLDLLLVCMESLWGEVFDLATGVPLAGVDVNLLVDSTTLGRSWDLSTTTDAAGMWQLDVPLVGDDIAGDGAWTLTFSMAGYDDLVHDGDPTTPNPTSGCLGGPLEDNAFADDNCFDSFDCWVNGTEDFGDDFMISHAFIQGMTYCDGLVTDTNPDAFDWGEEQPNVLVRLYNDFDEDGVADALLDQMYTDAWGYYQFVVELDVDHNGTVDADEGDFVVVAHPNLAIVDDLAADVHAVRNINVCPPFQP